MKVIGRYYKISKPITSEIAEVITADVKKVIGVEDAGIEEDGKMVYVNAESSEFPRIMERVINIFRKEAGVDLSFKKFNFVE